MRIRTIDRSLSTSFCALLLALASGCAVSSEEGASTGAGPGAASAVPAANQDAGEGEALVRQEPVRLSAGGQTRALPARTLSDDDVARALHDTRPELAIPMGNLSSSLRSSMTPVKDQGGRGTCATFASAGLIEYYTGGDISEQALVNFYYGNWGSNIGDRLTQFLNVGLVDERLAEYDGGDMKINVPEGFTYAQLVARSALDRLYPLHPVAHTERGSAELTMIKNSILGLTPVAFGIMIVDGSMPQSGYISAPANPTCNGVPITQKGVNCSAHAMIITGFNDATQTFEVKNQWGTGWGNYGYGTMTYDYLLRLQDGPLYTLAGDTGNATTIQSIQGVYENTIGRYGMQWEVDTWLSNLAGGGWTLPSMTSAFLANAQSTDAINAVYQETFGRTPAGWEVSAWQTNLKSNGWTIPEMKSAFAGNAQNATAVAQVFSDVFGETANASDMATWRSYIANRGWTIPMMHNELADSTIEKQLLTAAFQAEFGRAPTSIELQGITQRVHDDLWTLQGLKANLSGEPIGIVSASYGSYCSTPKDEAGRVANACEGKSTCTYSIDTRALDPLASGCVPQLSVAWRCHDGAYVKQLSVVGSATPTAMTLTCP